MGSLKIFVLGGVLLSLGTVLGVFGVGGEAVRLLAIVGAFAAVIGGVMFLMDK